jgi:PAS domain S-box-containing protein
MNGFIKSYFDRFNEFVAAHPPLSAPDDLRIAAVLTKLIPILFLGALINVIGSLIVQANVARYSAILVATTLICIAGIVLLRRGKARGAVSFIVIAGWAVVTMICVTGGGLTTPGFLLFSILSYVAGALLGRQALWRFTLLTVATILVVAILDANQWLPASSLEFVPYSQFFNFIALLTIIWSLQHLLTDSLTESLMHAHEELTSRQSIETALKKSEQRLNQSQHVARLGHYEFDLLTGSWTCSDTLNEVFGIPPEYEKNFRSWGIIVYPPDRPMMLEHMKHHVLQERKPLDMEYRIMRRNDGAVRWVHGLGTLEVDHQNKPVKIFGVIQDITARKMIEETLAAEREGLAVTLRSIGDGVITTDLEGNIVLMNRVAEQLTGWQQKDAAGKPLIDVFTIVNEYTHAVCSNPVEEVLRTKGIYELSNHTMLINRKGREFVISDSGAPIFDKANNIIGVVLVFRDSTEKQKLAEHIQRTDKLQSIGVLAGGLAHDFNNLLGGLFGYLELAQQHLAPDAPSHRFIEKALLSFGRMKSLTQQLLTFAKGGVPDRKTRHLGNLLKDSTIFALSGTNILPKFMIPDDLWPCDVDGGQIGQVVDNLVINARQAMPDGGSIIVTAENIVIGRENGFHLSEGRYVKISVKDTGPGILPSVLQQIFDPFFSTKEKGIGLGLTTVYSIVQKHGGTTTVESTPKDGATFHIFLPASKETVDTTAQSEITAHRGNGCILLMDDEKMILEVTKVMLERLGYSVQCSRDGNEALALIASAGKDHFKAVIMDLTIPGGMGGKEAIELLRQKFPDTLAFVASGYSNDPVLANPRDYGFTDKIQKPFRLEDLSQLLNRYFPPAG